MHRTATPRYLLLFTLLASLLGLLPARSRAQAPADQGLVADSTELRVLRQFYYATGGPGWANNTNWLQGTTLADAATWFGVGVSGGDVTQLSYFNNHLVGPLPACLGQLTALTSLNLVANQLSGSVPPALGNLRQLQNLALSANPLGGALPPELGQLTQLDHFSADGNQLTGELPASFGNWHRMQWLSIVNNQLTGPIPNSWGRLTQMRALLLTNNLLQGPLPDSLGSCVALNYLQVFNNRITGSLPASWGQLHNLSRLDLGANLLTGLLPAEFNDLTALDDLNLGGNQLTGPLPIHWERMLALTHLSLANNKFACELPASLGRLPNLLYCSLDHSQFSGALPAPVGQGWRQLIYLQAGYNELSGSLPDSLGNCHALRELYLNDNHLSGPLPVTMGRLTSLEKFEASRNELSGSLPATMGQLSHLWFLNLTTNQLDGVLPGAWGQLSSLHQLYLSQNHLQGPLPDSLGQLRSLQDLALGENHLTGPLPATWKGLTSLQRLFLQDNQLSGSVPDSLHAGELYLDRNKFSGELPASYATSSALRWLSFTGNQLTSLPSFLRAPNLAQLWLILTDNWLGFDSYERNQPAAGNDGRWYYWNYGYTQRQPPADTLQVLLGQDATLQGTIGGNYNHYAWQRMIAGQWVDIPQRQAVLNLSGVTAADAGFYRTRVTSDWVGGITLYSPSHYLDVLPYQAKDRNLPDDTNRGPGALLAEPLALAEDTARTGDVNYVRVWTPRVALTAVGRVGAAPVDSVACQTQYLDGLGRPVQTVQHQASPGKRDLVQPQAYDGLGREPYQFLPYPALPVSTRQGYHAGALAGQDTFYRPTSQVGPANQLTDPTWGVARTGAAYAETQFEPSPLNRVTAQGAAGEAWQLAKNHVIWRQERPNTDQDSVPRFVPGYDPRSLDPGYRGFYAAGELWGTVVADAHGPSERGAHGYQTIEWKDKLGQVVLKQVEAARTGSGTTLQSRWLRTAYAYDDFGHLRFVVQPEGTRHLGASSLPGLGSIGREQWNGISGGLVTDIPLTTLPSETSTLTSLEGPTNIGDNYGDRVRGYLQAPQTGAYTFWIAGDDNCEFWLSTDQDPTHKQRLAYVPDWTYPRQWTRFAQQQSAPVQLVTGQRYYLEVLHKEGGGGDNMAVTWQLPDGTQFGEPIAGAYLAPYQTAAVTALAPYLFHYRYDGRGRQIAKQVPGQDGETVVVYDQLDRPILSQDAQQRTRREWSVTKYDALGRVILTGLMTQQDTISQGRLQALAAADTAASHQYEQRVAAGMSNVGGYSTTQSFPRLNQDGFVAGQALTLTYYDDYDFDNDGQPDAAYDPSQDGQFAGGAAPVADALRTQGLTTSTRTRVLGVAETDGTQAAWLTKTTFYDERARPVQVQTSNARKYTDAAGGVHQGWDLLTTQLDFTGKVVQSVATHQGPSLPAPVLVKEFFTYDHAGRVRTTRQQLSDEARAVLLDSLQYNELGQLTRKTLGTGRLRQDVDYAYNIRGWLTSLNDPYSPNPTKNDLFGLSLHYERGFTKGYEQYNGNLTGQTWRGRDGVQRAYGYVYDPLNRLLQGDFVARQTTTPATPTAGAWKVEEDNYRLSFASYDDNGNILTLRRRGLLQNATHARTKQYGAVDNLTYSYQGNRLLAVQDAVSGNQLPQPAGYHGAPTSLAGDFQEGSVRLGQEYFYDAVGNLTQDKNKGITGIAYNHLNLPRQIHFGQVGDSVVFRYSAAGQKVAKLVYQTGKPMQRTDYLGPFQYEGDSLRFFPHAEGRVLRFVSYNPANMPSVSYQREFTLKDHLGNLRLAYRAGQARTYTATLEQDAATHKRESQQFDSLSVSQPVAFATPQARSGNWVARLNAGSRVLQPLGPLTQLGVQKGDTVTVSAYGLYQEPVHQSFWFSLGSFLANLLHPAQAPPPALDGQRRTNLPLLQVGLSAGLTAIPQLAGGVPQGYLRVLVFNKDSALVGQELRQLTKHAYQQYDTLRVRLVLPQDGYVTAYVGSQSEVDVYFDDMQVEHRPGLQVQETQYDPAGLELAGLAPPSPGIRGLNNYRFNGKEFQADLGLAWNHQDWRFFDPQLLRWHAVDPEVENGQESWTPYSFGYDNAVRFADADGRVPSIGPGDGVLPSPSVAAAIWEEGAKIAESVAPAVPIAAGVLVGTAALGGLVWLVETSAKYGGNGRPAYMTGQPNGPGRGYSNASSNSSASANSGGSGGGKTGSGRGSNNRTPDPEANDDHSVINGKGTTTYKKNPNNPNKNQRGQGFETAERTDTDPNSAGHANTQTGKRVPTPHRTGSKSNPEQGYGGKNDPIPGGVQPVPPGQAPKYKGVNEPGFQPSTFPTSH